MIANGMGAFPATISINWMMSSHLKGQSFLAFAIIFGLAVLFNIAFPIGVLVKKKGYGNKVLALFNFSFQNKYYHYLIFFLNMLKLL